MDVSLDTDPTARSVAEWRAYADRIEQHGSQHPVPLAEVQAMLGDAYEAFTKQLPEEYAAREAAYARVAAWARAHADKLENTSTSFQAADEESAQQIGSILAW